MWCGVGRGEALCYTAGQGTGGGERGEVHGCTLNAYMLPLLPLLQVVPLYLSEMAPFKYRGGLNMLFQLAVTIGEIYVYFGGW